MTKYKSLINPTNARPQLWSEKGYIPFQYFGVPNAETNDYIVVTVLKKEGK